MDKTLELFGAGAIAALLLSSCTTPPAVEIEPLRTAAPLGGSASGDADAGRLQLPRREYVDRWESTAGRLAVMETDASLRVPAATVASAPDVKGPVAGQWEITLGGVGGNDDGFDAGGGQLAAGVGYFLTDAVEVSLRQNLSFSDPGPGIRDDWNGSSRVALDVHLIRGRVAPYVGANVGWVYGDTVQETLAAGPEAGVKFYVNSGAFVLAAAEYQFFFDDEDNLRDAFEKGQFVYTLGIGMRF